MQNFSHVLSFLPISLSIETISSTVIGLIRLRLQPLDLASLGTYLSLRTPTSTLPISTRTTPKVIDHLRFSENRLTMKGPLKVS